MISPDKDDSLPANTAGAVDKSQLSNEQSISDPCRASREAFIETWVNSNADLSDTAREFLRLLVFSENGPWNDVENVQDVFQLENQPSTIYMHYREDAEVLELTFKLK